MKKLFIIFISVTCMLALITVQGYSMDTQELINKMIEAQGGKKKLKSVITTVAKGTIELVAQGGMTGTFEMMSKKPMMMKNSFEIMGMTIIQAYDGKVAWTDNPAAGGVQELSGIDADNQRRNAFGLDALWDPGKYGITYAFKGKEKIEDKDYYVLEQIYKGGQKTKILIDTKTYLNYKTITTVETSMQGTIEVESMPSEYKKTDGIMAPQKLTIYQNGTEAYNFTFESIVYNTEIADSEFKMAK